MTNEQTDLIAARLGRIVDRLQDDLREMREELRHQNELSERRLQQLEEQFGDHETRLRAAHTAVTQLRTWAGISSGSSGLLSIAALLRSFFGG